MIMTWRFASVWASTLLWLSCSSEKVERPPPASDRCGKELCSAPVVSGGISAGKSDEPSGSPTGDAGSGPAGQLSGEVLIVRSPDLAQVGDLDGHEVTIAGLGPDGSDNELEYDGQGPFEIELQEPPVWVRVESSDSDLITTIQGIAQLGAGAQLLVMERRVLSDVSEGLVLNPVALDPTRGHALIHFVDGAGQALANVSVEPTGGIVAYDAGATYTDAVEATSDRGAAILFNSPASALPGADVQLTITHEQVTTNASVPLARDALTLVIFELQ